MPNDDEIEIEMQCERCGQPVIDDGDECADCKMQAQDDEMSAR